MTSGDCNSGDVHAASNRGALLLRVGREDTMEFNGRGSDLFIQQGPHLSGEVKARGRLIKYFNGLRCTWIWSRV